jgi:DNA repair exonuclease SbcCD ATPase subunit
MKTLQEAISRVKELESSSGLINDELVKVKAEFEAFKAQSQTDLTKASEQLELAKSETAKVQEELVKVKSELGKASEQLLNATATQGTPEPVASQPVVKSLSEQLESLSGQERLKFIKSNSQELLKEIKSSLKK